jgi:hypothetical protein
MSNDSNLFKTAEELERAGYTLKSNCFSNKEILFYPLYEGKMVDAYNHRASSVTINLLNTKRKGQANETTLNEIIDPKFTIQPQYWVSKSSVNEFGHKKNFLFVFKAVTGSSNIRTMIASFMPLWGYSHSMSEIKSENPEFHLGCLNSLVFDYLLRCKLNSNFITHSVLHQCPLPNLENVDKQSINIINRNVIELSYTCWDIKFYADDFWKKIDEDLRSKIKNQWAENKFITGGHDWNPPEWCDIEKEGCPLPPFKWDEDRRAVLKAELDAIYAKLYGLTTDELRYILDPQDVYGPDFPGETFRVLKEKEIRNYGEFRTKRLVLEAWERLNNENVNCNRNN